MQFMVVVLISLHAAAQLTRTPHLPLPRRATAGGGTGTATHLWLR
jgi:hypothetical protein